MWVVNCRVAEEAGLILVNSKPSEVETDNPKKHFHLERIKIKHEKSKDGRSFYINFRILNKEMQLILILRQSFLGTWEEKSIFIRCIRPIQ